MSWEQPQPIENFEIDWKEDQVGSRPDLATALSQVFDAAFSWVNESTDGRFLSLDKWRKEMLSQDPNLDIKQLDDGYRLEADRLNAITQYQSKGFTVIDINPSLLSRTDFPNTLPYEFFVPGAGLNYSMDPRSIPGSDEAGLSRALNVYWRSIDLSFPGNFMKIEFMQAPNDFNNIDPSAVGLGSGITPPKVEPASKAVWNNVAPTETQSASLAEHVAKNMIYLNFSTNTNRPHIIQHDTTIRGYFDSFTFTVLQTSARIRITIGTNSEIETENMAPANTKIALAGANAFLKNLDAPLQTFSLTNNDYGLATLAPAVANSTQYLTLVAFGAPYYNSQNNLGTNSLWITSIKIKMLNTTGAGTPSVRFSLYTGSLFAGPDNRRIFTGMIMGQPNTVDSAISDEFTFEPSEPIRASFLFRQFLWLKVQNEHPTSNISFNFCIHGYSYGSLIYYGNSASLGLVVPSKFITDNSFINDCTVAGQIRN